MCTHSPPCHEDIPCQPFSISQVLLASCLTPVRCRPASPLFISSTVVTSCPDAPRRSSSLANSYKQMPSPIKNESLTNHKPLYPQNINRHNAPRVSDHLPPLRATALPSAPGQAPATTRTSATALRRRAPRTPPRVSRRRYTPTAPRALLRRLRYRQRLADLAPVHCR